MILPDQYYRPMVQGPRPLFKGYPCKVSVFDPSKIQSNPQGNTIIVSEFPIFTPVLVQMTVVHEPSLQLLQFATYLAPLLGPMLRRCSLLFSELAMLGSSLCESRKAVLGPVVQWKPLHGAYSAPQEA